jgi:hypothetical protein
VWAPIRTGSSTAPRDNCAGRLSGHIRAGNRRWTCTDANNNGSRPDAQIGNQPDITIKQRIGTPASKSASALPGRPDLFRTDGHK